MLTILLIALALYIFWLLFRNGPAFAERLPDHKRNWVGPTANQEEWRGYCADVFQPFSSRTTFYAIAYFANYIAVANAISWSIVYEGNYPVMMSRFGSYFIVSTHDAMLVAGFVSLAFFYHQLAIGDALREFTQPIFSANPHHQSHAFCRHEFSVQQLFCLLVNDRNFLAVSRHVLNLARIETHACFSFISVIVSRRVTCHEKRNVRKRISENRSTV